MGLTTFVWFLIPSVYVLYAFAGGNVPAVHMIYHSIVLITSFAYFVSWWNAERMCPSVDAFTAGIRLGGVRYEGWPWPFTDRIPDLEELFGYCLPLVSLFVPLAGFWMPLQVTFDTVHVFLQACFPQTSVVFRKAISCVVTTTSVVHAAVVGLIGLHALMTCCVIVEQETKRNLDLSIGQGQTAPLRKDLVYRTILSLRNMLRCGKPLAQLPLEFKTQWQLTRNLFVQHPDHVQVPRRGTTPWNNFRQRLRYHRRISMVLSGVLANTIYGPTVAFCAMAVGVLCNVGIICLRGQMNAFFVFLLGVVTISISIGILFTVFYCSNPADASGRMISFWSRRQEIMLIPEARRLLRSLRPIQWTMGTFFVVKRITALDMIYKILDCTVTFIIV